MKNGRKGAGGVLFYKRNKRNSRIIYVGVMMSLSVFGGNANHVRKKRGVGWLATDGMGGRRAGMRKHKYTTRHIT